MNYKKLLRILQGALTYKNAFILASTIPHGTCLGFVLQCLMTGFSRFKKEFFKKFMYLWRMRCRSDMKCATKYEWTVSMSFWFWLRDCFDMRTKHGQNLDQGRFPFSQNFRFVIPENFQFKWKGLFPPRNRASFWVLHLTFHWLIADEAQQNKMDDNRAVYTRENKLRLTLGAAYIRRERNHLYEYGLY